SGLQAYSTFTDVFLNVTIITIIGFLAFASWLLFGTVLKKFIDQHLKVFNVIMSLALVMATLLIWL
ncbi:LysE family translocator, partial [Mammaliicoccus sciuri]|nr:LysE family translocator [Mammaliicoccus sciuri]